MSDTPNKKLNTSKSGKENSSLKNENSVLADESDTISENHDSSPEASKLSKPPKVPYIDEESTIFTTARNIDSKTAVVDSGKKRIVRIIISIVIVLALLGSIFAITTYIPKDNTKTSSEDTSSSSLFSIPIVSADAKSITSVSVKNSVDSFSLYSKDVGTTSSSSTSDTSSEGTSGKSWFVTGLDEDLTNSSLISTFVDGCASLNAFKLMEDQSIDYGFDTPSTIITVTNKGDYYYSYTITVGNTTPDSSGKYVRVDVTANSSDDISNEISTTVPGNGNVYFVKTTSLNAYEVSTTSFANTKMVAAIEKNDANKSYFTDSALSSFDYLTLSGTNYESEIRIEPNTDTTSSLAFKVTKPCIRFADADNLAGYLTLLSSGLSASSVVSYSQTAETIASYGFNNPIAVITIKVGDKIEKLTVGSEKGSNYYVIVDGKSSIYLVATSSMAYVSLKTTEYYSQFFTLDNINTISSMQFKSDGQDVTFGLAFSKDENDKDVLTATYDGTTISSDALRSLYQYVLLLEPQEYLTEGVEGTAALTITMKYNNGNSNKVIKLTTYGDSTRQYLATVDGVVQGLVSKSSVTDIINNVKEVALGNEIKDPN